MYLLLIFIATVLLIWDYSYRKIHNQRAINIPGPEPCPLIGDISLLTCRSIDTAVNLTLEYLSHYGKTFRSWILTEYFIVTIDFKVVEAILSSPKHIRKFKFYDFLRAWLGDSLLLIVGRKWSQRRKIMAPAFNFNMLQHFVNIFDEQSQILVEQLKEQTNRGAFDIYPFISSVALDTVTGSLTGTSLNVQTNPNSELVHAAHEMSELVTGRISNPIKWLFYPKLRKRQDHAVKIVRSHTQTIIESRAEYWAQIHGTRSDDVVKQCLTDVLLSTKIDGRAFTSREIQDEIDSATFGGHDTTALGMTFALHCLSRHPDIQSRVFLEIRTVIGDDPTKSVTTEDLNRLRYLDLVVKETLRLYPPIPFLGRRIEEDIIVGDQVLPANSNIVIPVFKMCKDPGVFPDPAQFNPDRFSEESWTGRPNRYLYLPFSAGPRDCIGKKLAMADIKCIVSKVLRYFELLPMGEVPKIQLGILIKAKHGVHLGLKPRLYSS